MLDPSKLPGSCASFESFALLIEACKGQGYTVCLADLAAIVERGACPKDDKIRIQYGNAWTKGLWEKEKMEACVKRIGGGYVPTELYCMKQGVSWNVMYRADYLLTDVEWEDEDRPLPDIVISRRRYPFRVVTDADEEEKSVVADTADDYGSSIKACAVRNLHDVRMETIDAGIIRRIGGNLFEEN